jgi:hypothetical protein
MAVTRAFDWSGHDAGTQSKFKDWDLSKLEQVYHKRNAVVHRDETPIGSDSELVTIAEFFRKVLYNVAYLTHEKHAVPFDLVILASGQALYEKFDAR